MKTSVVFKKKELWKSLLLEDTNEGNETFLHKDTISTNIIIKDFIEFFLSADVIKMSAIIDSKADRSLRKLVIGNSNEKIANRARRYGMICNRYHVDGDKGLEYDPVHESRTCTVYFVKKCGNEEEQSLV